MEAEEEEDLEAGEEEEALEVEEEEEEGSGEEEGMTKALPSLSWSLVLLPMPAKERLCASSVML